MYDLAVSAGVTIAFNTEIVSVSVDQANRTPRVVLADGTRLTADLIIGADGAQSVARMAVTGEVERDLPCDHSFFT
jgi:2-polyprenyl-6-methoxyphenol hydroxylase-like FAD-dependent oxidoreductase